MSRENVGYLISSSLLLSPLTLFNIAEIRMHLTLWFCSSEKVCVCPLITTVVTHLQKGGSAELQPSRKQAACVAVNPH